MYFCIADTDKKSGYVSISLHDVVTSYIIQLFVRCLP